MNRESSGNHAITLILILSDTDRAVTRERLFPDFAIRSNDGEEIPCHKVFLASQSKVMLAMLETDMKEKATNCLELDHDKDTVRAFVEFFYTGRLEKSSIDNNCRALLDLAVAYDHPRLKEKIVKEMIEILDNSNMIGQWPLFVN